VVVGLAVAVEQIHLLAKTLNLLVLDLLTLAARVVVVVLMLTQRTLVDLMVEQAAQV
jgi:hypothetical protein